MLRTGHLGAWADSYLPTARGFHESLAYLCLTGRYDHFTQEGQLYCPGAVDLWLNDGPATALNGTDYNMHLFRDRALALIDAHDASAGGSPLFLLVAFENNHAPLQVPDQYMAPYPDPGVLAPKGEKDWRKYQGMITAVDVAVGSAQY